ncbi:hypothetical protein [Curtobacterium sp. MCSS17_016]|uniref:hypothetical protein n=1 Tax=Curtobacterium sp. MCSS17_016 TaxID=2175644 RepID=UPI000DAAC0F6|nr:hypothetical protein [Curtobacterium sp. MCSS17_016]WIE80839.1 hypothetical protein DEJ19_020195 [Curtobacterium sp. MCSS17_016]
MSSTNEQVILAAITATGAKPVFPVRGRSEDPNEQQRLNEQYQADVAAFELANTAWDQALKGNARDIKIMLTDRSAISKQLTQLDKAIGDSNDGKVFVGTIVNVTKEATSQRGLVTLHTGTDRESKGLPLGQENVRTDRTDNPDGQSIARLATRLVGHRVTVYIELEPMRNGNQKVRVLRHVEDLGVDPAYDAASRTVRS